MNIVSIGPLCITAGTLKSVNLRTQAYPFDWIFSSLSMVKDCIETGFSNFLNKDFLVKTGATSSTNTHYKCCQENIFNHHDLTDESTYNTYKRRCERFMNTLKHKGMYMLYMVKDTEEEAYGNFLDEFVDFMQENHPTTKIIYIRIIQDDTYTFSFVKRRPNCAVYNVHYGKHDNLESIMKILKCEASTLFCEQATR